MKSPRSIMPEADQPLAEAAGYLSCTPSPFFPPEADPPSEERESDPPSIINTSVAEALRAHDLPGWLWDTQTSGIIIKPTRLLHALQHPPYFPLERQWLVSQVEALFKPCLYATAPADLMALRCQVVMVFLNNERSHLPDAIPWSNIQQSWNDNMNSDKSQ